MPTKRQWAKLEPKERMELLVAKAPAELAREYTRDGLSEDEFRAELLKEKQLWDTANIADVQEVKEVPTKDVVLGAWRDLDRAEALMELIDNSIDAWNKWRRETPRRAAKELIIAIRIDPSKGQLQYEDNAGGVPIDKLAHLVVPGFSDTDDLSRTIGSYKTGGKKAVFRLAVAARIVTRHWDPSNKTDDAVAVQLDQEWLEDSKQYAFTYSRLKSLRLIPKDSTTYVLKLRDEANEDQPWYSTPALRGKVVREITNAYTLLMIRNPNIKIYFDKNQIKPNFDLYDFSGMCTDGADILPQQVIFHTTMEHKAGSHKLEIEVVLGCRVTTGVKEGRAGGIDLYGNNRLFVSHDQELFSEVFGKGNSRNLVRGYINIHGPNIFIPWDTHKRHLNEDRSIVRWLATNKLVRSVFENWKKAYRAISRLDEVGEFIKTPLKPVIDKRKKDLAIPNRSELNVDLQAVNGPGLPNGFHSPTVPVSVHEPETHKIALVLSSDETRGVMAYYGQKGEPTTVALKELAELIKEELMEWVIGTKHE